MALISMSNATTLKIKFDQGLDLNDDRIVKTKTYSSIKADALHQDLLDFANLIASLQEHTLVGINRIDNTSLSE